jgi:hypothetical protein
VLVDGDPTTNIGDLRKLAPVITQGKLVSPSAVYQALGVRPFVHGVPGCFRSPRSQWHVMRWLAIRIRHRDGQPQCGRSVRDSSHPTAFGSRHHQLALLRPSSRAATSVGIATAGPVTLSRPHPPTASPVR